MLRMNGAPKIVLARQAWATRPNPRGVPDPQLVTELREQTLEPVNGPGGFDPYAYRFLQTLQTPVERLGLAALVVQAAQSQPIMIIARLLSSEPWSLNSCQVYSVEGADAVI